MSMCINRSAVGRCRKFQLEMQPREVFLDTSIHTHASMKLIRGPSVLVKHVCVHMNCRKLPVFAFIKLTNVKG